MSSSALMVGSSITQAFGSIQAAKANASAASYNSSIAQNNSEIATQNAEWATQEGDQAAMKSGLQTRAQIAGLEANQGASGVEVGTGSFKDVVSSAREVGMLDALTIRSEAARRAYGYKTEAVSDTAQSQLYKDQAKYGGTAGAINTGTTVLSGAAKAYEMGGNYSNYLNNKSTFSGGSSRSSADDSVLQGVN